MNKKLVKLFVFIVLLVLPAISLAQDPGQWFKSIVTRFISLVVWPVFVGLTVIMSVWAGILFLTSRGDPAKTGQAQKFVMWIIVGIFVGVLAYSAVTIITSILPPPTECGDSAPACDGTCPDGQTCKVNEIFENSCFCE